MCFQWNVEQREGGTPITPLKTAAHALKLRPRQRAQPSRRLPSQSPRILINRSWQLTFRIATVRWRSLFSKAFFLIRREIWVQRTQWAHRRNSDWTPNQFFKWLTMEWRTIHIEYWEMIYVWIVLLTKASISYLTIKPHYCVLESRHVSGDHLIDS